VIKIESKALPAKVVQRPVEFRAAIPYEDRYLPVEVKGSAEDVIAVVVITVGAYLFLKWLFSD